MPRPKLTARQTRFVEEYMIDLNASAAARRAGYSMKTAHRQGQENLQKPAIRQAIEAKQEEIANAPGAVSAEWIIGEMRKVAAGENTNTRDRLKALELLGKIQGLFVDRKEVSGRDGGPLLVEFVDPED